MEIKVNETVNCIVNCLTEKCLIYFKNSPINTTKRHVNPLDSVLVVAKKNRKKPDRNRSLRGINTYIELLRPQM